MYFIYISKINYTFEVWHRKPRPSDQQMINCQLKLIAPHTNGLSVVDMFMAPLTTRPLNTT